MTADRAQRRWRLRHADGRVDERLFVGGIKAGELARLYPDCTIEQVGDDGRTRDDGRHDDDRGDDDAP